MKKRFLAFLLAVCVAVSMLVLPASAVGSNAAVQTATALGGLTAEQAGSLGAPLTRGQAARLLTAFSAYRDTTTAQGRTGRLYSDVDSDSPYAVYIRTAVQNGWMTGYSDGSFRPDNTVTLEEACTMALRLLGYDVAKLGGTFPTAQLSKASALGLRNEINARQGETLTLEQGTMLFYNALTAMNGSGQVYASTLGFAVSNGQVDISSVLLDNVKGPFVADASTVLPFAPAAIYRNDEVTTSAALSPYDVYYYNESARTVWIYNKRAAGRVTAVSPSASAPTSVTVAGVTYTIASPSVAYQLSSLSGGGVGQVVTLLLGMNDEVVSVLTGDEADALFGLRDPDAIFDLLFRDGCAQYVAIKDGGNGAWAADKTTREKLPPYPCKPIEPIGAGDGFNAGFLAGILQGRDVVTAGRMGAICGALATQTPGDVEGYPDAAQMEAALTGAAITYR